MANSNVVLTPRSGYISRRQVQWNIQKWARKNKPTFAIVNS